MRGKSWLLGGVLATLLAGPGCASCGHWVCKPARDAGPDCAVPLCDRQQVYVFLVNGVTPSGPSGLEGLRDRLAEAGFTKAYCGQLYHAPWMGSEMRRIRKEEPGARFVCVGYDLGGAAAAKLAADAKADGLPVDGLILLDPTGKPTAGGCAVPTLLVRSGSTPALVPHTESRSVPEAGHFTLPAHPQTVAAVADLLAQSAARVEHPPALDPPWEYEHAPPLRAVTTPADGDPVWTFLLDQAGPHNTPLNPPDVGIPPPGPPVPEAKPAPPAPGPVVAAPKKGRDFP